MVHKQVYNNNNNNNNRDGIKSMCSFTNLLLLLYEKKISFF
ncbi:MAG: hypothetical protein N7Q72_03285 [Spiroplasma sp. Tabriz.8]|nr:hypothetical protein [Spiroplasma sp. Tabriz.8]